MVNIMAQGEIQQTTGVWHDCDEAARSFDVHAKRETSAWEESNFPWTHPLVYSGVRLLLEPS